jgi:8-oxo-dGTP diphosphatase
MRHTSDDMSIDHLALAILRHEDQIVMVRQHNPYTHQPFWVLPGGLVEPGELVGDALIREVKEEAGIQVAAIGRLVGLSQVVRPARAAQTIAFFFDIGHWEGMLECQDPDGEVSGVELVTQADAISRLEQDGGWAGIGEPLLAYLRGEICAGAMWFYREGADGQRLVGSVPPAHKSRTGPP